MRLIGLHNPSETESVAKPAEYRASSPKLVKTASQPAVGSSDCGLIDVLPES